MKISVVLSAFILCHAKSQQTASTSQIWATYSRTCGAYLERELGFVECERSECFLKLCLIKHEVCFGQHSMPLLARSRLSALIKYEIDTCPGFIIGQLLCLLLGSRPQISCSYSQKHLGSRCLLPNKYGNYHATM